MTEIPFPKIYMRDHLSAVSKALKDVSNDKMIAATSMLKSIQENHGRVFLCGNGGSATTASHFANDLIKMAGMQAICLNDMTSTVLAYMNDDGVDQMFANPFAILATRADILVAISCSGNSANIVGVVNAALVLGIPIIVLTGDGGGNLAKIVNVTIRAPHPDIKVQEDVHLAITHALAGVLAEKWD